MYSMLTTVNNLVLHILKLLRVDLKRSHHKRKQFFLNYVTDVNNLLW